MADKRIDQLPAAEEVLGTTLIVVADPSTGEMSKATTSQLPAPAIEAEQGLTIDDDGKVILGQDVGADGNPATLTASRQLVMGVNALILTDASGVAGKYTAITANATQLVGDSDNSLPATISLSDKTTPSKLMRMQGLPTKGVLKFGTSDENITLADDNETTVKKLFLDQTDAVEVDDETVQMLVVDTATGKILQQEVPTGGGDVDFGGIDEDVKVVKATPQIILQSPNADSAVLRLTESTDGSPTYEGLFVKTIGTGNRAVIGTHNTNSTSAADDIESIQFERATGNVVVLKDLAVNGRQPGGLFNQTTPVTLVADGTSVKDPIGAGIGLLRIPANSLVAGAMFKIIHIFKLTSGAADQDFTYKVKETSGDEMSTISVVSGIFTAAQNMEIESTLLCKSVASSTATLSIRTRIAGFAFDSGFADFDATVADNHNISIEMQFAGDGDGQQAESMLLSFKREF